MAKTTTRSRNEAADRIRSLVRSVVLAQGNIFIRELLRRKGLTIGATKEDFEANLMKAIDTGELQLSDVTTWLDEVEGWGDQHVYLYRVPARVIGDTLWNSAEDVRLRLPPPQRKLWGNASLEFQDCRAADTEAIGGTATVSIEGPGAEEARPQCEVAQLGADKLYV
jgi:hypothetical protein